MPRCVSTGPAGDGSEAGDATPQSGPGQGGDTTAPPPHGPINGLPNYMMTCYPFVPPGDPRFVELEIIYMNVRCQVFCLESVKEYW